MSPKMRAGAADIARELRRMADDVEDGTIEITEWSARLELIDVTQDEDEVRNYRPGPRRRLEIVMLNRHSPHADERAGEKSDWDDHD